MTLTMSKITFRADEELVGRLDAFDASKSEVMREALRAFLDAERAGARSGDSDDGVGIDDVLIERIDDLIESRLDSVLDDRLGRASAQDVNVNISVDGGRPTDRAVNASSGVTAAASDVRKTAESAAAERSSSTGRSCKQCGENLSVDHVYCPNCGEKASNRIFCECGDELRSDWAFCPGCGRRTPAADVLDRP